MEWLIQITDQEKVMLTESMCTWSSISYSLLLKCCQKISGIDETFMVSMVISQWAGALSAYEDGKEKRDHKI